MLSLMLAASGPGVMAQRKKQKQGAKPRVETAAEVKRKQENAQREIKATREKIRLNEQEV